MDIWSQLLASLRLDQLTSNAILSLVILFIVTGKLQWHSVGDAWKDLYFREQKRADTLMQQNTELITAGKVHLKVLDSLPAAQGGDSDVETTTASRRRRRQGNGGSGQGNGRSEG